MSDFPALPDSPSDAAMLVALLEKGVEAYNRDLEVRALEGENRSYELETERMQVEAEMKIDQEKIAFNRHAIDRYYDNDWKKFRIKAAMTSLAIVFFMVVITVLLVYANDFSQRFDLLKSAVTILLALLSGKSIADLFKRDNPPSEEK